MLIEKTFTKPRRLSRRGCCCSGLWYPQNYLDRAPTSPKLLQVLTADGSSEKSLLGEGHKTQDIPKPGMAHISAPFNPAKNIRAQELTTITSKDREGKRDHV